VKRVIITIGSLLLSVGILLFGHGLLSTLLTLRGAQEGFSEGTIGMLTSMYFLGYITGTFFCPKIIRRVGHIRTIATLAATFASTSILQGFWINVAAWSVVRFVSGICIVGAYMVIESWLNAQASNDNRGRVFGIYQLVNLLFLAMGQFLILTGDILALDLFAIAAALITFSLVPVALTRLPEPTPVIEIKVSIRKLYRLSPLGFMGCFISGLVGSVFYGLGPLYAQRTGFSELGIAVFMSTTILGGIILQMPVGNWSDRHDRRLAIMLVGFLSAGMCLLASFVPRGEPYLLSACFFVFGGMLFSMYPLSVAHTNDHPGTYDRVTITTNLLLTYGVGAAVGPLLVGTLMNLLGVNVMLIYFMLGGFVLGFFAYYRRSRGVAIPVEQQSHFQPQTRTSQVMADTGLAGAPEEAAAGAATPVPRL
jgi:MFS family permease